MKEVVYKIEEGMNREEVKCTTYQMRNFYHQLRDGFFTNLDIMNYIQHLAVARMMKPGYKVLDMCCGRNLMLPLMRYNSKDIKEYTGIDIRFENIQGNKKNICNNKDIDPETHYPFKTRFLEGDVAEMPFENNYFNLIIYTSSIEHMQKEDGLKSLSEAYRVLANGGVLFLSCPNTPEDKDGFDTQYKAHVYEWKQSELEEAFKDLNFKVLDKIGLIAGKRDLEEKYKNNIEILKILNYIPNEFSQAVLAVPFPDIAKEILYILKK